MDELLLKFRMVEKSNSDPVIGVYINQTGSYHIFIQHFLENDCYEVR
ncbi:MAG: hypothetical protein QW538_03785 [Thermoplasmatales archaeon]